jgi:ATP synthase protein I
MGSRDQDPGSRSTDEAALSARLRRLGERLDHIGTSRAKDTDPVPRPRPDSSGFARGFRLSTEFVAGVLLGALVGWLVDRWLHISPWGLIVFLLLGFAAGVLNVMRAAGLASNPDAGTRRRDR